MRGEAVGGEEMDKKVIIPYKSLNTYPNGTCRTIKSQYIKNGTNNFTRTDHFGATGVIRKLKRTNVKKMEKRIIRIGEVTKGSQAGIVYDRGGYCTDSLRLHTRVCDRLCASEIQTVEKKNKILCDLGVGGERGRVMSRKYCATAITATEYKDPQKVIKRFYERDRNKTGNQR